MSGFKTLKETSYHIVGGHRVLDAMMKSEGSRPTGLNTADFIIFMGGTDISPDLYDEPPHVRTQPPNRDRDRIEIALYKSTPTQYRVGVCRGAQLLHVLNGGSLWQHVEGHLGPHDLHYVSEVGIVRTYQVSSTHHQMMKLRGQDMEIWATADKTTHRELHNGAGFSMNAGHWTDAEVLRYRKTNTLCFQPHPEFISPRETRELFYRCLTRMVET